MTAIFAPRVRASSITLRRLARGVLAASLAAVAALQIVQAHDVVSLVGAYGFTENAGLSSTDASGNSNTAALLNGTGWGAGKFGSAVVFDGTNDFVSIPNSPSLQLGRTGTVEAWVSLDTRGRWNGILGKATSSADQAHSYALEIDTAGKPFCLIGNGTSSNLVKGATSLQTQRFYHLACTWDGAQLRLYLDGALSKSVTQTITPAATASPLVIGQYRRQRRLSRRNGR